MLPNGLMGFDQPNASARAQLLQLEFYSPPRLCVWLARLQCTIAPLLEDPSEMAAAIRTRPFPSHYRGPNLIAPECH